MRTADFDYELPPELIAQTPAPQRDESRLLLVDRATGNLQHSRFPDVLSHLRPGDALVLNDSRVIPARLRGRKAPQGGEIEMLLLEEVRTNLWWVMLKPGKRTRPGTQIDLYDHCQQSCQVSALVREVNTEGHRLVEFMGTENIVNVLDRLGEVPLPPYIERKAFSQAPEDLERYQTVYARTPGSVAAPTAGLHFTQPLLSALQEKGVLVCHVTLHVGLGTFAPVKADELSEHLMHQERYHVSEATARALNACRRTGHRVFAAGTTSVRVLETVAAAAGGEIRAGRGSTNIFIYPPYSFRAVDGLITNFHLPRSTLLMLVSAFCAPGDTSGRELALRAYREAVREKYRFFSYGDAMLIL